MTKSKNFCTNFLVLLSVLHIPLTIGIPVDNGVVGNPEIRCGPNSIGIIFDTQNTFEGHVFVKGRYAEPGCRTDETGQLRAGIELPFSSCGLRRTRSANPPGLTVDATVIISFHPLFVTKVDRAYSIQCFYMEAEKTVTAELEVSMLTTELQTQQARMPICRYEVLQAGPTGPPIRYARIGDQVYHKWTCDSDTVNTFCMTVHTCFVADGEGQKILILDSSGCALDRYLLGNLEYTTDLMAGRESHVFKYADKPNVYFNCQVRLELKDPNLNQCQRAVCQNPEKGKRKRDTHQMIVTARKFEGKNRNNSGELKPVKEMDGKLAGVEVDVNSDEFTVLDLNTRTNPSPRLLFAESEASAINDEFSPNSRQLSDQEICLSRSGFGVFLAMLGAVLVFCALTLTVLYRRARMLSDRFMQKIGPIPRN